MMTVRPSTIAELHAAHNIEAVLDGYYLESAIAEVDDHKVGVQVAMYEALEASGKLHALAAWVAGDEVAGFLLYLDSVLPHYGVQVGIVESFYVLPEYRKSGAGLKLLDMAEEMAKGAGAKAMLVSAPRGGRLADVLPGVGYRETNRVFTRGLA